MRAMRLTVAGQLVEADIPRPSPAPGELLIQVRAAGVTKTELQWDPTLHTKTGERRIGAVPGHEFSGVVADTGQEVFGMNDWYCDGAMSEYCVASSSSVISKPRTISHETAAAIPIAALTAWQALFEHAKLQSGEAVLIHGGAGAVGTFAVQLAKLHGARVIATASARNIDFVGSLGADQVVDYTSSPFEQSVGKVDVVFDTVGGETLERSWSVLKPGGRLVTIASAGEKTTDERVKKAFFIVEPNQKQLTEIATLVETGHLQTIIDAVVPFDKAQEAYAGNAGTHGRGKVVVSMNTLSAFFKGSSTELGNFYPAGYLVAIFPDQAEAEHAVSLLSGQETIAVSGSEVIRAAGEIAQKEGMWGLLMRELSRFFGTEEVYADNDLALAKTGSWFVTVYCPTDEAKDKAWQVLDALSPVAARHYARSGIEHLRGEV